MTFLAPWLGLAALAAIPLILLYLLKMKRLPRVVSSTLLWQQSIRDLEANVPFQKLRANLLLILQLLALALIVFALMRPTLPSTYRLSDRSVLVLDVSASMLATDAADAPTRFAQARGIARNLVGSLRQGQRMMILAGTRMVTNGFLEDKARLLRAIDTIEPVEAESDPAPALQLAYSALTAGGEEGAAGAGQADAAAQGMIYLVSDGAGLALPADIEGLGDVLTYFTVGSTGANAAVTGMEFRRPADASDRGQLFVNVANFGPQPRSVLVSLRRRGEEAPFDAAELALEAGQSSGVTFDRELPAGAYEVRLSGDDALPLDNRAALVLSENRPLRAALVSPGHPLLERFLASAPGVEALRAAPEDYRPSGAIDLYLMADAPGLEAPADRTAVYVAPTLAVGPFEPLGLLPSARVLDWNRDDPAMRFVSMSDVRFADDAVIKLADSPRLTPLVWSAEAPLICYARSESVRHYCIAFRLEGSTWPRVVSFPIFLGNVLDEARRAAGLGQATVGRTGALWPVPRDEIDAGVTIEMPGGETVRLDPSGAAAGFARTDRAGFYTVRTGGAERVFAMNLDSVKESDIAPQAELKGLAGETIRGQGDVATGTREIWPWAAIAAVLVLLAEWYVYNRRIA